MPEATEAAGVPLRVWFMSAATVYVSAPLPIALTSLEAAIQLCVSMDQSPCCQWRHINTLTSWHTMACLKLQLAVQMGVVFATP